MPRIRALSKPTSGDIHDGIEGIRSTWSILHEYHDEEDCVHAYTDGVSERLMGLQDDVWGVRTATLGR